ncbi:MAG: hypothetical protein LBQ09_05390 [Acidobacteriaceae bacterium]|nr:hypothetical protein [Acidobacteriaceae bacterium]
MQWFRGRLPAFLAAWLLVQLAGAVTPVVLMAADAIAGEQCTCPLGDHATCPMHHSTAMPKPDTGQCAMKSTCAPMDAALLGMAGGIGVLVMPSTVHITLQQTATVADLAAPVVARVELPDAPPPRI